MLFKPLLQSVVMMMLLLVLVLALVVLAALALLVRRLVCTGGLVGLQSVRVLRGAVAATPSCERPRRAVRYFLCLCCSSATVRVLCD